MSHLLALCDAWTRCTFKFYRAIPELVTPDYYSFLEGLHKSTLCRHCGNKSSIRQLVQSIAGKEYLSVPTVVSNELAATIFNLRIQTYFLATFHKLTSWLTGQTLKFSVFLLTIILLSCNDNSTMDKKYGELTEKDYEHKVDTVDGEEIYFKTAVSASIPQDFINLDTSQKLFIKHSLQAADTLIRKHQLKSSIDNYTPRTLDSLIDVWNDDSSKFACSENYFVNAIGTAFGQFMVKTYKMKWKIVSDGYGTDYAATISELNLSIFPLNSVVKAIEQKREGSLQQISLITKRQIEEQKKEK